MKISEMVELLMRCDPDADAVLATRFVLDNITKIQQIDGAVRTSAGMSLVNDVDKKIVIIN